MRTAAHVVLTPIVFFVGASIVLPLFLPMTAAALGVIALTVAGVVYGWRERHR